MVYPLLPLAGQHCLNSTHVQVKLPKSAYVGVPCCLNLANVTLGFLVVSLNISPKKYALQNCKILKESNFSSPK